MYVSTTLTYAGAAWGTNSRKQTGHNFGGTVLYFKPNTKKYGEFIHHKRIDKNHYKKRVLYKNSTSKYKHITEIGRTNEETKTKFKRYTNVTGHNNKS